MESASKALTVAAGVSLLGRFRSLWEVSSRGGRKAVLVLLLLAVLKPVDIGTKATLAATLFGLISSWYTKTSKWMRWIVALGSVPVVGEAIRGGDADIPAVGALLLGLMLNHCSAAGIILIMVTGGEALEEHALEQAGSALHSLLENSPGIARLADSGKEVATDTIVDGDELLVKQDEVVPVDGILQSPETCLVDERLLTGESVSATKTVGQLLMAGSVLTGSQGTVKIKAKGSYEDSILHQMKSSLKAALERKGKIELASKRLADALTPMTIITAAVAYEFVTRFRGFSPAKAWDVVLSVLMSATPCPAAIGVPIAMLSGMSVSSKLLGATVKSGEAFEALVDAKVLVLDKTGTITTGKPTLVELYFHNSQSEIDSNLALELIANIEFQAKHVLADAIVREFERRGGKLNHSIQNFENRPGLGVSATINNYQVRVGSKNFCLENNSALAATFRQHEAANHLVTYFMISSPSSSVTGAIAFEDPVRDEAKQLVEKAKARGLKVVMLSGDSSSHLQWVAENLKVDRFHTCLPHEKVEWIRKLQQELGKTVMVGDGANDSAALAAADVGISVDPSGMASESAKVVLLNGDVSKVFELMRLSSHVVTTARRTVTYGMTASGIQMLFSATGSNPPFISAMVQEIVDLGATLYSLRALHFE